MISEESQSNIIASSQYNFQIELMKKVGSIDVNKIIKISEELVEIFGPHSLLNEKKIHKYFNNNTLTTLSPSSPMELFQLPWMEAPPVAYIIPLTTASSGLFCP